MWVPIKTFKLPAIVCTCSWHAKSGTWCSFVVFCVFCWFGFLVFHLIYWFSCFNGVTLVILGGLLKLAVQCEPKLRVRDCILTYNGLLFQFFVSPDLEFHTSWNSLWHLKLQGLFHRLLKLFLYLPLVKLWRYKWLLSYKSDHHYIAQVELTLSLSRKYFQLTIVFSSNSPPSVFGFRINAAFLWNIQTTCWCFLRKACNTALSIW